MKRLDKVVAVISNKYIMKDKVYTVLGVKAKGDLVLIATETKERKYLKSSQFILEAQDKDNIIDRLENRGF